MTARDVRAIILDIEGTTTPIAYVTETLFPYARRHLRPFLQRNRATCTDVIDRLLIERGRESEKSVPSSTIAYVEWLMDRDRKSPALKDLQGRVWEDGYRSGELVGEVFPDVPIALERWHRAGISAGIFSSGSVLAQRLLFGHTRDGDLTPCFNAFFDTETGAKTSSDSYRRIAAALGCAPGRLLFISDVTKELDAARAAGCPVVLCCRPGNAPQSPAAPVDVIDSLEELEFS